MRQSMTIIPTLREVPSDAEVKSHQLLLRAGFMRQTASGIYSYLPLGLKVIQNVEKIIREEMERAGAVELLMPTLQQAELWQESGRWNSYGPELMRMHDRHNREFALGPTHEEVITSLLRDEVKSYKKLPLTLYQIPKFRDEKRPRFGLLRGREFIMKDAYSFHSSQESLDEVYDRLFTAYSNIFSRCGLNFRAVIADSGAMGGKDTHEFMVLSEIGEDTIAYSDTSNFAANIEMAPVVNTAVKAGEAAKELEKMETPDQKTIEEVSSFLKVPAEKCLKTLLWKVDGEFVVVLVRGDHELNDIKLKNLFNAAIVEPATPEETKEILGVSFGSLGPVNMKASDIKVVADAAVQMLENAVCGANEDGFHYVNVNPDRDFPAVQYEDLRFIQEGDPSPDGQGTIRFAKGIEVGHVFKLGTRYSESMSGMILDENGRQKPMIMGCYGIGVSRTVSAIAEQFNDEKGLIWPVNIAPYQVHLIPVNMKDEAQKQLGEELYEQLTRAGYDVLIDDRPERAGVKFADSDLIGMPVRVTVGKKAAEGIIEMKIRENGESFEIPVGELLERLKTIIG